MFINEVLDPGPLVLSLGLSAAAVLAVGGDILPTVAPLG